MCICIRMHEKDTYAVNVREVSADCFIIGRNLSSLIWEYTLFNLSQEVYFHFDVK